MSISKSKRITCKLRAAYKKVRGAPAFRVRADYATLQSYFEVLHAIEAGDTSSGLSEDDIRKRIGASLDDYWTNSATLAKRSPTLVKRDPYREYPGKVSVMHAVYLSHDMDANAEQIVSFLEGFEEKYPKQPDAFETVVRTRLVALQKTGRYADLAKDVDTIFDRYQPEKQKELLAGLSGVLERDIRKLRRQNDKDNELVAKRMLARLHEEWLKNDGEFCGKISLRIASTMISLSSISIPSNTTRLRVSIKILSKSRVPMRLSPLSGLAQISEVRGNSKRALSLWEAMLKGTQVGDPLWFRGTFEVARLNDTLGNSSQACKTVSSAQRMLKRLGDTQSQDQDQGLCQPDVWDISFSVFSASSEGYGRSCPLLYVLSQRKSHRS